MVVGRLPSANTQETAVLQRFVHAPPSSTKPQSHSRDEDQPSSTLKFQCYLVVQPNFWGKGFPGGGVCLPGLPNRNPNLTHGLCNGQ